MLQLRPYQQNGVKLIKESFLEHKKIIILQAPTGAGKTVMFCDIAKKVSDKGKKVLIVTDRIELLYQSGGSLQKTGLKPFLIQAGLKHVSHKFNAYVAMSQTLRNRDSWLTFWDEIDLIIIDECHKQEFNWIFENGYHKGKHVIGFTATPVRSGKMRQLGLDYEKIIELISVKELIQQGYLVNDDYYAFDAPDTSDVAYNHMKGDYNATQLFKKYDTRQLYAGVVENYKKICSGTKTLVFCVNVEHAIKTTLEFVNEGISAKFIVSKKSKPKNIETPQGQENLRVYNLYKEHFETLSGDRKDVFNDFENGKFQILVNVDIATTGYDCPSIETVIINRKTMSLALLLQMLGRGSRIFDGKTHFNVLDFGSNCNELGFYSENRNWYLWHNESKGGGLPPMKTCGYTAKGEPIKSNKVGCKRMILAMYQICPFCGFKYPEKKLKEVELSVVALENGKAIKSKRVSQMTDSELYDYWKMKKHKTAWLWRQLYYKGGENKIKEFGNWQRWNKQTIEKALMFCQKF